MNIREGASRRVSFDTREELGDKIDKLTVMMGKLAARIGLERDHFLEIRVVTELEVQVIVD